MLQSSCHKAVILCLSRRYLCDRHKLNKDALVGTPANKRVHIHHPMALAIWNNQYFSMWLQYVKQQCLSYNSNWCRPKVYSLPDINVPYFCFQQVQLIYQLCFGQRHSIKSISYLAWLTTYKLIHFDRNLCKTRPQSVSIKGIHIVYFRVCEASAGCLRSIYPSLGMSSFLVTSQWASDVTINRPN